MVKKSNFYLLAAGSLFFFWTGCATQGPHVMTVRTDPAGAQVIYDGKSYENTPTPITMVEDGQMHYLFIEKDSCAPVKKVFMDNDYPESLDISLDCQ